MTYRNKHGDFITVGYLPKRKKICLVVGEDENGTKVASFDDDEAARLFVKTLERMLRVDRSSGK